MHKKHVKIIKTYNIRVINKKSNVNKSIMTCNCRQRFGCHLEGNCLFNCIIYKATVSSEIQRTSFIDMITTKFNHICNKLNKSFNHEECLNETERYKYIRKLKRINTKFNITCKTISGVLRKKDRMTKVIYA